MALAVPGRHVAPVSTQRIAGWTRATTGRGADTAFDTVNQRDSLLLFTAFSFTCYRVCSCSRLYVGATEAECDSLSLVTLTLQPSTVKAGHRGARWELSSRQPGRCPRALPRAGATTNVSRRRNGLWVKVTLLFKTVQPSLSALLVVINILQHM